MDRKMRCVICGCDDFADCVITSGVDNVGNPMGVSVNNALTYACRQCGRIEWFLPKKTTNTIYGASTSIAALIGTAKGGPCNEAVLVQSFSEFETIFGGFISSPRQHLAYAVDAFFKNGGKKAYIVRAAEQPQILRASLKADILTTKSKISVAGAVEEKQALTADYDAALSALEEVDDASVIAAPGMFGADIYGKMIAHCSKMKYRFAILDPPPGCDVERVVRIRSTEMSSALGMAAVYYPWLRIVDPVTMEDILIPPSGAVAGIYAANDNNSGVHKAPANISLASVTGLETNITNQQQEALNHAGVNAIRYFADKGHLVWGARTISEDPYMRYINVRRTLFYLEQSICNSTHWAVPGPNDGDLWIKLITAIEEFLTQNWQAGMMMGTKPEEAFYVQCGLGRTMTPEDILNERLIVEIGVALVRPAEFIRFRIMRFIRS
jgi:phage tail sheath protein FI